MHPIKQHNIPISGEKFLQLAIWQIVLIILMTALFIVGGLAPIFMPITSAFILMGLMYALGGLSVVGMVVIAVFMIIHQFKWQEAFNERIRIINPNARMVDFI